MRIRRKIFKFRNIFGVLGVFDPVRDIRNSFCFNGEAIVNQAWIDDLQLKTAFIFHNDLIICSSRRSLVNDLNLDDEVVVEYNLPWLARAVLSEQDIIVSEHVWPKLHTELGWRRL